MDNWAAPGSGQSSLSVHTMPAALCRPRAWPPVGIAPGRSGVVTLPLSHVTGWWASSGLRLVLFSIQVTSGLHLSPSATHSICRSPEPPCSMLRPLLGLSVSRPAFAQENLGSDSRRATSSGMCP